MVSALEPLKCEVCHEGFLELIEKQNVSNDDQTDEEKRRANEQYRIVFNNVQGGAANRLDLYDRNQGNIYGTPDEEGRRREAQQRENLQREEEKKREEAKRQ